MSRFRTREDVQAYLLFLALVIGPLAVIFGLLWLINWLVA